jgi:hypothetical protein
LRVNWSGSRRTWPSRRTTHDPTSLFGGSYFHDPGKSVARHYRKNIGFVYHPRSVRLPLGILTGIGFIGGGAILRRDGFILGVTTAATLWFVTVVGLCFGGGQIKLGIAAFALGMAVLEGLRWFDYRMKQEQHGTLSLTTESDGSVTRLRAVSGPDLLVQSATDAVQSWKFEPFLSGGKAIEVETTIAVDFELN